jgi:hypothetical protein
MEIPTINKDNGPAKEENKDVVTESTTAVTTTPVNDKFVRSELIPANWSIVPLPGAEEDVISATNSVTGRVFEGTIADFSAKLRGE